MNRLTAWSCALLLLCGVLPAAAQPLRFSDDGTFRIVQFTDTHLCAGEWLPESEKTFARISRVIATERPDLVVFTGDVVTGRPAEGLWRRLLDTLQRCGAPFCIVLGNHDAEPDLSRQEIARLVTSAAGSLNGLNAGGELADAELPVLGHSDDTPAAALYCLDSHDYSTVEGIGGYGWFTREQIEWLRGSCEARTAARGGAPLPALAFFHIVLPEAGMEWHMGSGSRVGRRAENECPGALNPGMFAAMAETGSVLGVFVGHDHDNDYIVAHHGIALGYGRFSGGNTTYNNLRPGARVIVLHEGERGFETWIREDDGRRVDYAWYAGGRFSGKRE